MKEVKGLTQDRLLKVGFSLLLIPTGLDYYLHYSPGTWDDELSAVVYLLFGAALFLFFRKRLVYPWQHLTDRAQKLAHDGSFVDSTPFKPLREQLHLNQALVQTAEKMHEATELIKGIEAGNLDEVSGAEESMDAGQNELANSIVSLRDQMKKIAKEEDQRRWTNEGLATFINILRSHDKDLEALSDEILSALVKYVKANQGALYLADGNEDGSIKRVACYAYGRKKYLNDTVQPGEGLVGQAFLEKNHILLTDVPSNFIKITSGLGDAPPNCVLIIPIMLNEEINGVLELASFKKFLPYQVDFLKKLCESIASTISSAMINEKTNSLLEASQQTTEELRAQEEEMRQNMEELQATQEEMSRKQKELENIKNTLEEKNKEVEAISLREKERADAKIQAQKRSMMKALDTYKAREVELENALKTKDEEINRLLKSTK